MGTFSNLVVEVLSILLLPLLAIVQLIYYWAFSKAILHLLFQHVIPISKKNFVFLKTKNYLYPKQQTLFVLESIQIHALRYITRWRKNVHPEPLLYYRHVYIFFALLK